MTRSNILLPALLALLSGCATYGATSSAFSYRFADNQVDATGAVVASQPVATESAAPTNALGIPIAVATTHDAPRAVVALSLESGTELWRTTAEPMTRPQVLGDVILFSERENVIALSIQDGRELWRQPIARGLAYLGGARDADTLVFSASVGASGGARRIGHVVAVNARSGALQWRHRIEGVLGQPAARGGHVFVPWERQNIAILGLHDGLEVARLRSTDDVISWIFDRPEGVYYGWRGMYRFDERSHAGTQAEATRIAHPLPQAPRDPLLHDDAFSPKPGTRSARGRIRMYMDPLVQNDGSIVVQDDIYYYVYYRYVFAAAADGDIRWVRILDEDSIAGQVVEGGLLVAGERGTLRWLDSTTGNDRWTQATELPLASLEFDASGFSPGGEAGELRDLRAALNEIASDPDNRLVPARAYAIELLASLEEPAVTRDLLDLYAQRAMPGALREAIEVAMSQRESGSEYLVEALDQGYDYLAETRTPPLRLIVPALVESDERRALPGLVRHMLSHETPAEELATVVRGVVALGDASIVPALRSFLVLYHADSTFRGEQEALAAGAAADGLFQHGGAESRSLLTELLRGRSTNEPLVASIGALFDAEHREQEAQALADAEAQQSAAEEAAQREYAALPFRLAQPVLNQSFAEHADLIRDCYNAELNQNASLSQVRIVFIVDNDGKGRDFRFAPNRDEFVECMQPIAANVDFPRFRDRRQPGSVTIAFGTFATQGSEQAEERAPSTWWGRSQARAASQVIPTRTPWWEPREPAQGASNTGVADAERPPGHGPQPWWSGTEQPANDNQGNSEESPDATPEPEQPWWLPVE